MRYANFLRTGTPSVPNPIISIITKVPTHGINIKVLLESIILNAIPTIPSIVIRAANIMCKLFCIVSPIPNNVIPIKVDRLLAAPIANAVANALTAIPADIAAPAAAA